MQLDLLDVTVLAVVQGVAEFLPISSSGHLVVVAGLLAGGDTQALDVSELNIVLHLGTLGSIFVVYWHRIWRLLGEDRATAVRVVAGTVPAVLIGLPVKKYAEWLLEDPLITGFLLIVTGLILLGSRRLATGQGRYQQLSWSGALWIGLSQAAAVLPGLSRSGLTITAGMARGLSRESAATFSFLLAIPAIGGAGCLELLGALSGPRSADSLPPGLLTVGAAVAFLVGVAALWWLLRWLQSGRLHYFAWWCLPLGLLVVVWRLLAPAGI